jgi:hypothetical protein
MPFPCIVAHGRQTVRLPFQIVNFMIKPTQPFGHTHRGKVCVCVFIKMSVRTCISIYICTIFPKKSCVPLLDLA